LINKHSISILFGLLFVVLFSRLGFAQNFENFNDVAENITNSSRLLPGLISGLAYVSGVVIAASGIFKTVEHVSNPTQTPIRVPIMRFLTGGALFALPIIIEAAYVTINGAGGENIFVQPSDIANDITGIIGNVSQILSLDSNLNSVMAQVGNSIDQTPFLISAVSYLLALVLIVSGIFMTRDHVEDPTRVSLRQPVIRFLTGGALLALGTVYQAMYTTIAGSGLGIGGVIDSLFTDLSFLRSTETGAGLLECGGRAGLAISGARGSLGNLMCYSMLNVMSLPVFLTGIAYILGLIFGVWGILKIKDHVNEPSKTPLNEGITRFIAGGAFFALPYVTVIMTRTFSPLGLDLFANLTNTNTGFASNGSGGTVDDSVFGQALNCSGNNSLDQAMGCFMTDLLGPTHMVLNFFCYVAGMIFIMIGISRVIKSSQEGARGPGGMGTVTTFVVGGLLISATTFLRAFSSTFFGSTTTDTRASLAYTTGMSADETAAIYNVISAVIKFMIIIGMISFVRGIFIMRDVAEGKQQASTMSGITHIIGGALAVNLGPLLNAVQTTLGITAFGVTFN